MPGASKSGPFSGRVLLRSLINQLQLKVQLGDSDFLEAKDLGGVATSATTEKQHEPTEKKAGGQLSPSAFKIDP